MRAAAGTGIGETFSDVVSERPSAGRTACVNGSRDSASKSSDCRTGLVRQAEIPRARLEPCPRADRRRSGGTAGVRRSPARSGCCRQVESVHLRASCHQEVRAEGLTPVRQQIAGRSGPPDRSRTATGRMPQLVEHLRQDQAIGGVVVHDQDRQPSIRGSSVPSGARMSLRLPMPSGEREPEGAAAPEFALDPDRARPSSRPACTRWPVPGRCRRIGAWSSRRPARRLEDRFCFVGGNADAGVGDGEMQADARSSAHPSTRHGDDDFAALGELDGVADQIDEDLPQPAGVADHRSSGPPGRCGRPVPVPFRGPAEPGS